MGKSLAPELLTIQQHQTMEVWLVTTPSMTGHVKNASMTGHRKVRKPAKMLWKIKKTRKPEIRKPDISCHGSQTRTRQNAVMTFFWLSDFPVKKKLQTNTKTPNTAPELLTIQQHRSFSNNGSLTGNYHDKVICYQNPEMIPRGLWSHMVSYGSIWVHMGPYGPYCSIWAHMGPYGSIWVSYVCFCSHNIRITNCSFA